jgi:hypothetical protein
MCDPITIGIGLMVAGSVANSVGQNQAAKAQARASDAERARKAKLTAEQEGYFADTLDKVGDTADPNAQAAATARRDDTLQAAIAPSPESTAYLPGTANAPAVVKTAADKAMASGRAESSQLARAIAAMGGTGDALQGLDIGALRNRQNVGQLAGFKSGSAAVLEDELRAAAMKGGTLRGLGQLATSVGSMAVGGGMGGMFAGGGAGGLGAASIGSGSPMLGGGAIFGSPIGKTIIPFAPFG